MAGVAVVAESARLRSELGEIVRASGRFEVVCGFAHLDGVETLTSEQLDAIDVLLIDATPDSAATSKVFDDFNLPLVILSDDTDLLATLRSVRTGVALLPSSAAPEQIVAALEATLLGLVVIHPSSAGAVWSAPATEPLSALTPRENEVLQMLASGLGNKAIAARLGISDHTAKFHVAQILAKLGAASRAEAVSIAMRRGLVPL